MKMNQKVIADIKQIMALIFGIACGTLITMASLRPTTSINPAEIYKVEAVTHKRVLIDDVHHIRYSIKVCAQECIVFESDKPKPLGKTMRFQ